MRCYLAHPVTDYGGTARQRAAIAAIEAKGWKVENPDKPWHQSGYQAGGMGYFLDVVENCDALAFMRFPCGAIGAGVAKEVERALQRGMPVYDFCKGQLKPTGNMMPGPLLTVEETRGMIARLRDLE